PHIRRPAVGGAARFREGVARQPVRQQPFPQHPGDGHAVLNRERGVMQLNMRSRIEMTPRKRAGWMWLILLSCILAGCAGGSGSSGFDVLAENAAIQQALDSQDCDVF